MANSVISRLFKRSNLLPQDELNTYNDSLERLKHIEQSFNSGSFDTALDDIEKYYNNLRSLEKQIPILLFDTLTLYIKILIYKCNFDVISNLLKENEQLINTVSRSKTKEFSKNIVKFYLILGTFYFRKGDYTSASEMIMKAKDYSTLIDDSKIKLTVSNHLSLIDLFNGNFHDSLKLLNEEKEMLDSENSDLLQIYINNNLGLANLFTGNLDDSFIYFTKARDIAQKSNYQLLESIIKNNIGLYYLFSGNLQDSSKYLEENLQFFQQYDLNYELANTYVNLSSISEIKGEIVQSQADLANAFGISNTINNNYFKNVCNNNLANLTFITGEFESAKQTYLQCLDFFKTHNLHLDSIYSLFNLLSLAVLENDIEAKSKYLKNISEIKETMQNDLVDLIYQISRALDLKQADRMVKKAESQQIFTNIANSSKLIQHEFKVIALKNLSELLIEELSSSGDQEVIDELKTVLNQITEIEEKQNSLILRVESYLIQSKVDLLEFKLNEARTLLAQAQTIAEEKELTALSIFVSREYDNLLNQIAKFQDQKEMNLSDLSMNERLELAELENMVNKIIRKKAEIPDIKEESPFMFLIIAMSGMSIFSKIFVDQDLMDEQLIGGFITAINIVTQQAFSDQDAIEGIRHQDFTLLLKYLGSTRILCVYVFKGQTYFAMQKLKTFIETVQYSGEAMSIINDANEFGEIISDRPELVEIVRKIFQEADENSLELAKRNFFSQKISSSINLGLTIDDVSLFS